MRYYTILQPFAEAHRELFWHTLRRCGLHPRPLSEAREVCLDEPAIEELMVNLVDFDIVDSQGMAGRPYTVIELDIDAVDAETRHLRRERLLELLGQSRNTLVSGLTVDELFEGVKLSKGLRRQKRNRIAWLSDAVFWATNTHDELLIQTRFGRVLEKVA